MNEDNLWYTGCDIIVPSSYPRHIRCKHEFFTLFEYGILASGGKVRYIDNAEFIKFVLTKFNCDIMTDAINARRVLSINYTYLRLIIRIIGSPSMRARNILWFWNLDLDTIRESMSIVQELKRRDWRRIHYECWR